MMKRLAVVAILILAMTAGVWHISRSRTFQFFGEIVPRVETDRKVVALTFDDGPAEEATDTVLAILHENGVRATFFLIGSELERNPEAGRRIAAAGHEMGNHSWSHDRMVLKSPEFIRDEIERTDRLIRATGYSREITFRPPFGKKLLLLPWYLARNGRRTITWDLEPDSSAEDARRPAAAIVRDVVTGVRPGSIILLHVMYAGRTESLGAVSGIIRELRQKSYQFLTVSELLSLAGSANRQ